jgi:hypothetical protein
MSGTLATSRLARLAQRRAVEREAAEERCDLCGTAIGPEHRHLLDDASRELACACRACALLFDRGEVTTRYRAVPERRLQVADLELDDLMWEELRLPVDIAFLMRTSGESDPPAPQAFYPGPMGATESLLRLEAFEQLEAANPILTTLQPDVEALLVDRARGARRHWIVPIDECFALVGLIRTRWRGLTGGKEVWQELDRFFDVLDERARPASRNDGKEPTWPT